MEAYSVQSKRKYDPTARKTLIGRANDDHEKWDIELRRQTNKGSPRVGPYMEAVWRSLVVGYSMAQHWRSYETRGWAMYAGKLTWIVPGRHWLSRSQRQRSWASSCNAYTKLQCPNEVLKGDGDDGRGLCTTIQNTRQVDNV